MLFRSERDATVRVSDRGGGTIRLPNAPWRFDGSDVRVSGEPRYRGEDNRAVLSEVLSRIQTDYVEEPNFDRVTDGALQGMVESLDPYNSYLTPQLYTEYKRGWRGEASIGAANEAPGGVALQHRVDGIEGPGLIEDDAAAEELRAVKHHAAVVQIAQQGIGGADPADTLAEGLKVVLAEGAVQPLRGRPLPGSP